MTEWVDLLPQTLVALAWVLLPGAAVAVASGARGFTAVAVAPLISVTVVACAAIMAHPAGVPWAWWQPVLLTVLLAGGAVGVRLWWRARGSNEKGEPATRPPAPAATSSAADASSEGWAWLGVAVGVVLNGFNTLAALGRPDAFSQTFDNIFHLSAVRLIHDTGQASSLAFGGVSGQPGAAIFYPAAFHDLVSLVLAAFPHSITLAMNGTLLAITAVVWPLACVFGVRCLWRANAAAQVGAGALSAVLPGFPLLLLEFGVLYPNLLGLALLPAVVGLVAQALEVTDSAALPAGQAVVFGLLSAPGLALAHPNVVMTLILIAGPLLVLRGVRTIARAVRRRELTAGLWVELAALGLIAVAVGWAWPALRPPEAHWPPILDHAAAVGRAVLQQTPASYPAWVASAVFLVGAWAAFGTRRAWLAWSWFVVACFWVVVSSWEPGWLRDLLTGVWYNDSWRFAANLPVVALPVAALGIHHIAARVDAQVLRLVPGAVRASRLAIPLILTAALVTTTFPAGYMSDARDNARSTYALTSDSPLVNTDELRLIERLPELVPPDAVIATNPWNGSSLVYALTGLRTTTLHVFAAPDEDLNRLNNQLDEAGTDPSVCPVAERMGVDYALDFGEQEVHSGHHPYPGFDNLGRARGFVVVAKEGQAVLYRLTACD